MHVMNSSDCKVSHQIKMRSRRIHKPIVLRFLVKSDVLIFYMNMFTIHWYRSICVSLVKTTKCKLPWLWLPFYFFHHLRSATLVAFGYFFACEAMKREDKGGRKMYSIIDKFMGG